MTKLTRATDKPDTSKIGWKNRYRNLEGLNGFKWCGFSGVARLHMFQRGTYRRGFEVVHCRDSECFDGTLRAMIDRGITRTRY